MPAHGLPIADCGCCESSKMIEQATKVDTGQHRRVLLIAKACPEDLVVRSKQLLT